MKDKTQVAVIGGGVVGCSILYHLTKAGWKDVVLLERDELTCGSSWHAAGGMHTINSDKNISGLQEYTIKLYKEIEEISGQSCSMHLTGGIMLASTQERLNWLKMTNGQGRYLGRDTEMVTAAEAKEHFPLMDEKEFVGGMYDPFEGHVDPSGVTNAYAKSARINGAEIYRKTKVEDLQPRPDGTWDVITNQGTIHAEHVINAGGLWAREVGRMVGLELPILAMEHHYILTDEMPEVVAYNKATGKELMHVVDFEGEMYLRQERTGMLLGTYEKACVPWSEFETPWDFGHELLQSDLERIAPSLEVGFKHFPPFANVGIRKEINGPFTFAPDGNPLVGPVRGLKNFWVACGVMAGFSQGGGVGLTLANWIIDGDPGEDISAMDVSRYGDWVTMAYTNAKVRENYSRRFQITFPNEELPAARPLRRTAIYDRLNDKGAVWGSAYGLENALWFAPKGVEPVEDITFKRSNAFEHVGKECMAVRESVGLLEISGFAKYHITGKDSQNWLNRMMANKMPDVGKMLLSPMLNEHGKVIGDFSLAKLAEDDFYIFGSGVWENYHLRHFESHLDGDVRFESCRDSLAGISIAGPDSRKLLQKLTRTDLATENFPFLSFAKMDVGMVPSLVGRVSFTGDLGYEIWVAPDFLLTLYETLISAGEEFNMQHFGLRALNSLRLEKSFGGWMREYRPDYPASSSGMDRFIAKGKNDFIGRQAFMKQCETPVSKKLICLSVDVGDGKDAADAFGNEPIWLNDKVVGWVTSGGYGYYVKKSLALGFVDADAATATSGYEVEVIAQRKPATRLTEPAFDPKAMRMRG